MLFMGKSNINGIVHGNLWWLVWDRSWEFSWDLPVAQWSLVVVNIEYTEYTLW